MKKMYKQIKFGTLANKSDKQLYKSTIISFDIDWAPDYVLEDALTLAHKLGIKPTLFLTHDSPLLKKIFRENNYEFGLHPNFEKLLNGDASNGRNSVEVLKKLTQCYSGIKIIRSHSLTTSSRLKALFQKNGFLIESSFISHGTKKKFPNFWKEYSGLLHVPITWEDDVWFTLNDKDPIIHLPKILQSEKLNVLTFHPIHLYLNTTDIRHYEKSRKFLNNPEELIKLRDTKNIGVRSIFKNIGEIINGKCDAAL